MLAFISDLHLTDGSSGETIRDGAFRIYFERLREMAYNASFRNNGKYKPIERIDLILLGDILDVIRSTSWLETQVRPWDDPEAIASQVASITDGIIKNNQTSLAILKSLSKDAIDLPPATVDGVPQKNAKKRMPVKVRLHYMVGNHDWFYHLPGCDYDNVRAKIVESIGLENDPKQPFPHDPSESDEITKLFTEHNVFARHGDSFDSYNFEGERDKSSLGDAIVIELIGKFPETVKNESQGTLPDEFHVLLREIDNVRPVTMAPVWIDGLARRLLAQPEQQLVKKIWNRMVDEFFNIPFVKSRDSWLNPLDDVDKLQAVLRITQSASFDRLSGVSTWLRDKLSSREKYYSNALSERAFKSKSARFIVYGHTHQPEIVPLDASCVGNTRCNQMYFNSGTWRQVHELALSNPDEMEFIGYNVMTYLAFFKDDERMGRPFDYWSGALATLTGI